MTAIASAMLPTVGPGSLGPGHVRHCQELGNALQRLALTVDGLLHGEGPPRRDDVRALRLLTTDALHALGAVVQEVNCRRWDGPFDVALRTVCSDFADATGVVAHVRIRGSVGRLSDEVASALRRVVVEALANVNRHARASVLVVMLDVGSEGAVLDLVDDGVGLSHRQATVWGSSVELGLHRMRLTMRDVGGSLTVHPLDPRGLRLRFTAPASVRSPRCR